MLLLRGMIPIALAVTNQDLPHWEIKGDIPLSKTLNGVLVTGNMVWLKGYVLMMYHSSDTRGKEWDWLSMKDDGEEEICMKGTALYPLVPFSLALPNSQGPGDKSESQMFPIG